MNNAGIVATQSRVEAIDAERLQHVAVNVVGAFLCAREAIKRMSKKHGGRAVDRQRFLGRGTARLARPR